MPIIATNSSGDNFEKAPTGMQQAVCVYVHDIGNQRSEYQGKPIIKRQVIVTWELAEKFSKGDFKDKPFLMSKYYTLSLNEKANLRKDLESWRGKSFSEDELKGFDVENLIGANCFLNITATETDKRKISAITPLPKNMEKIPQSGDKPSDKFVEWINRERAKAVELKPVQPVQHDPEPTKEDDLPF